MNRRIARNGLLVLGLSAIATLLPTHTTQAGAADQCTDCLNGAVGWVAYCQQYGCWQTGGCTVSCEYHYNEFVQYCMTNFC
jgi:hypothetical protein